MLLPTRSPLARVRKRIPPHARSQLTTVEAAGVARLQGLTGREAQYALAFIASVWARNSALAGRFPMTNRDYMFIQRCGITWVERLPPAARKQAREVVDDLKETGLIPT
jgi:hypothetical protein